MLNKLKNLQKILPITEIAICIYETLNDRKLCAPDDYPPSEKEFKKYQLDVKKRIDELRKQGLTVREVVMKPVDYFNWLNKIAKDDVKKLSPENQRSSYAGFFVLNKS